MKKHSDKNDKTLVELTLLGDDAAYEELVERHRRAVMGTAYKETGNSYSAEDASQDAFVSAWMNLSALRDGNKFGPWVCSIAKNSARTLLARYRSTIPAISLDSLPSAGDPDGDGEWALIAEDYTDLHDTVEALNEKLRETVKLHYFEDKTVSEIAQLLGVPEGTVKWRLSEGRKQLRKEYGIMEKTYDENETLVARVMRQVEALKLWGVKNDKTGLEKEYRAVLKSVESLDDSREKSHLLADTLLVGYWWLPGEKNDETMARVKKAAEDGHNDDVMQTVAALEHEKLSGAEKIDFMKNVQIPRYRAENYPKTLAYVLFWLGYEYYEDKKYDEAIGCFEEVTKTVPPPEVYYANALSAIEGITLFRAAAKDGEVLDCRLDASGEGFRREGNTLLFVQQPGFGCSSRTASGGVFWNLSCCDGMMLDGNMKEGDVRTSSDGKVTMRYTANGVACDTPAGHFENCSVFVRKGEYWGLNGSETVFCPGVGIVRQTVTRGAETTEWLLADYRVEGGEGLLPFAVGNRWSYVPAVSDAGQLEEWHNVYTVTAAENAVVTVSGMRLLLIRGYADTWEGKTLEVRERYCDEDGDGEKLRDIGDAMRRCEALAGTKRQKTHTAAANRVMRRIFAGDPVMNPDYTEKGKWDFFERNVIRRKDGKITAEDNRRYSFEWKDVPIRGEGDKVLYSFFMTILSDAMGCLWSDEWTDGYCLSERKADEYTVKDVKVTGGETVVTPAGRFENCRRLSFDFRAWGYFTGKSDYLFAPGVGIVRFEHPLGGDRTAVWDLTEYRGTGDGFFPIDDGLFRRYEPRELGEGWNASAEFTFDADETGTVMFKDALGTRSRAFFEMEKN